MWDSNSRKKLILMDLQSTVFDHSTNFLIFLKASKLRINGIRTHDILRYNDLANHRLKPLSHYPLNYLNKFLFKNYLLDSIDTCNEPINEVNKINPEITVCKLNSKNSKLPKIKASFKEVNIVNSIIES